MNGRHTDFPGMREGERIVFLRRRHWSILAHKITKYALLAFLPIILNTLMRFSNIELDLDVLTPGGVAIALGVSAYYLLIWLMFFHDWIDYYLDALIVTNERIVHIEQRGLFDRTVADLALDRIQDVTVETKGMIPTFLHYGTIQIQSAAERERFVFSAIPEPEIVKAQILASAKSVPPQRQGLGDTAPPPPPSPPTPPRKSGD